MMSVSAQSGMFRPTLILCCIVLLLVRHLAQASSASHTESAKGQHRAEWGRVLDRKGEHQREGAEQTSEADADKILQQALSSMQQTWTRLEWFNVEQQQQRNVTTSSTWSGGAVADILTTSSMRCVSMAETINGAQDQLCISSPNQSNGWAGQ